VRAALPPLAAGARPGRHPRSCRRGRVVGLLMNGSSLPRAALTRRYLRGCCEAKQDEANGYRSRGQRGLESHGFS
jgi:hypothetical protein